MNRTEAVIGAGIFKARMRTHNSHNPWPVASYVLRTDKSNLWVLEQIQAAADFGKVWGPTGFGVVGWTVEKPVALKALANRLLRNPELSDHPRLPYVRAWSEFVAVLPSLERARLVEAAAKNPAHEKTYRASDYLAERQEKLAEFSRLGKKRSCRPVPLPKNFQPDP